MSIPLHNKLRLEIIIERPALRRVETVLKEAGATGWTVLPAISGFGGKRRWSRGTDISGSSDMVVLVSIGDAGVIEDALTQLHELADSHIGVLNVAPVTVLRPTKF